MTKLTWLLLVPTIGLAQTLPSYKIDRHAVTVSGLSSGAFMSVQMQVAFSKTFSGAGSVAGGPYWCAEGNMNRMLNECMKKPNDINVDDLLKEAQRLAAAGAIDPLSELVRTRLYIYHSQKDTTVNWGGGTKLKEFMNKLMPSTQIFVENGVPSAHGFPTLNNGVACNTAKRPYILKCNHDTAKDIFETMYGSLNPRGTAVASNLKKFSQKEFGDGKTPLYSYGWIYVPQECANGVECRLHLALHGCQMTPDETGDKWPTLAGYNEWAETNHIIVLYPNSLTVGGKNPLGCWDMYGFTGTNYVTQSAPQMAALKKMVDRVMGN